MDGFAYRQRDDAFCLQAMRFAYRQRDVTRMKRLQVTRFANEAPMARVIGGPRHFGRVAWQ